MPQRSRPYTANVEDYEVVHDDDSQWEEMPTIGPATAQKPRQPITGRGTQFNPALAKERLQDVAQGAGAAIPFAGIDTPDSGAGIVGRVAGEAALWGAPVGKGMQLAARVMPTRAKAGLKFQEVMRAVGDKSVDIARPGDAALRITELAERGSAMPKVVRDFLRRSTDPGKGDITYKEARDFYSNISRLSADEMKRLSPVIKRELGGLRESLKEALAKTAASGGKERVYRSAMREYAVASKLRELAEKGVKIAATGLGAGAALKAGQAILD